MSPCGQNSLLPYSLPVDKKEERTFWLNAEILIPLLFQDTNQAKDLWGIYLSAVVE